MHISIEGEQTNLIMVGIGIKEVVIPVDRKNVTILIQTVTKQTKVEQIKVLHLTIWTQGNHTSLKNS